MGEAGDFKGLRDPPQAPPRGFSFLSRLDFSRPVGYLPHRTRTLHVSTMIAETIAISSIHRVHPGASLCLLVMLTNLLKNGRLEVQPSKSLLRGRKA